VDKRRDCELIRQAEWPSHQGTSGGDGERCRHRRAGLGCRCRHGQARVEWCREALRAPPGQEKRQQKCLPLRPGRARLAAFAASRDETHDAEDAEHAAQVVAIHEQRHFATHLLKTPHQEVVPTEPALEGTERVLAEPRALAHLGLATLHVPA
jgi:hypothetical protein